METKQEIEQRQNLKDYYKYTLICSVCHKEYGMDVKDRRCSMTCPVCSMKQSDRNSILSHSKKSFILHPYKRESKHIQRQP